MSRPRNASPTRSTARSASWRRRKWVGRTDGTREEFGGTHAVAMGVGDVFVIATPGGGGFGATEERKGRQPRSSRRSEQWRCQLLRRDHPPHRRALADMVEEAA